MLETAPSGILAPEARRRIQDALFDIELLGQLETETGPTDGRDFVWSEYDSTFPDYLTWFQQFLSTEQVYSFLRQRQSLKGNVRILDLLSPGSALRNLAENQRDLSINGVSVTLHDLRRDELKHYDSSLGLQVIGAERPGDPTGNVFDRGTWREIDQHSPFDLILCVPYGGLAYLNLLPMKERNFLGLSLMGRIATRLASGGMYLGTMPLSFYDNKTGEEITIPMFEANKTTLEQQFGVSIATYSDTAMVSKH